MAATACAGVLWASYGFFIGRLGGKVFEDNSWIGLLLALGIVFVISALIEAGRRAWQWRARKHALHTGCPHHRGISRLGSAANETGVRRP